MSPDATLADLVQALRDERAARGKLHDAKRRVASALDKLRSAHVPATLTAIRIAKALGATLSVHDRQRLADALRQRWVRASRAWTDCHADPGAALGAPVTAAVGSVVGAITPGREKGVMSKKLIRKTTTILEYLGDRGAGEGAEDDLDEESFGEPDQEEVVEDEAPRRHRAGKSRD